MLKIYRLLLVGVLFLSVPAQAAVSSITPLAVAIVPPLQFPVQDFAVLGVRLSAFWGYHRSVYGLDFGLIGNRTELNFGGIAISGVFNLNQGPATVLGLQAAGVANVNTNKASIFGLQFALGLNSNQGETTMVGAQVALANYSPYTTVIGLQVGVYNRALVVNGFQIGLINFTDSLHGIQIGLVNFNNKGLFSVAPIINIGF